MMIALIGTLIYSPYSVDQPHKTTIKVMNYNIHQYYQEDPNPMINKSGNYVFQNLLNVIEAENPDIVVLEESEGNRITGGNVNGVPWLASRLNMFFYYGPDTSDQIYGVSLLSKWPISSEETFMLPSTESIERVAIRCVIDHPDGEFYVVGTHFQTGKYKIDRENQAKKIVEIVGDSPTLILGDFNTRPYPSDNAYMILNNTFNDAWVWGGNDVNDTAGYTDSPLDLHSRIDYIWFTKNDWTIIDVGVTGNYKSSDHMAVFAEFTPDF